MQGASAFADLIGKLVDVVPFGEIVRWAEDGTDCGVMWEDARDVFRVVVEFAAGAKPPKPEALRLQYWQSSWPHRRAPRDKPSGAGKSGWLNVGDWFQGEWKDADTKLGVDGNRCAFTFAPINAKEFADLDGFDAVYRTTLKLRVLADAALPEITSFRAYTDSVWRSVDVEIEWGGSAEDAQVWDGRLEVFNGHVAGLSPVSKASGVSITADASWKSTVKSAIDGIRARILYAETKAHNSHDETVVTVRAAHETFSFAVADLLRWGHIFIPDYGVLVRRTDADITYASADKAWRNAADRDLYSRVFDEDEQTLARAWSDTPAKGHHMIPLGFEGGRQHFGLDENGELFCNSKFLKRIPDVNTERCRWEGDEIRYSFGLAGGTFVERTLDDGCLPIVVTTYERNGVRYRQTAFVAPLKGVPKGRERILAEDILVCMMRIEMERAEGAGGDVAVAELDLRVSYPSCERYEPEDYEELLVRGAWLVGKTKEGERRRMRLTSPDPSATYSLVQAKHGVEYRTRLTPEDPTRTLDVAVAYVPLESAEESALLDALEFEPVRAAVQEFWRTRIGAGAQIRTPEPMINEFYRAHVPHMLITTEREPGGGDRTMARVGCFHYGVFGNESCMVIADLNRRGFHVEAERALETFIHYQGTVGLPGDYSTKDGQLYGAGGYEDGGYNQHHGWILWGLAQHYRYTRDAAWLRRVAPHVVKACDWIINERARTVEIGGRSPMRAIERGLLPPGSLEDIGDWRSWLSNNVYSWWGLHHAADVLMETNHPEGERLVEQAETYRADIIEAFAEAMRRAPVVRLRDGRWIPHIPSEVHRRGRTHGWITETLEGAMHLVVTGALEPWDRRSTWILDDFEDNLCISEQYGYSFTGEELERRWFSHGGISQQASLLLNPIAYLLRDETKHFLRAYFNAFAVSYFADTRMMTEHALPEIGDWYGDHYKTSDEANSTHFLRLMFVMERGDELWLGAAVPRYWLADGKTIGIENAATYFGPMSVTMESRAASGKIEMRVVSPLRNPPRLIRAGFRHPESAPMTRCEVNGRPYERFEPDKEWVVLDALSGPATVVAYYR